MIYYLEDDTNIRVLTVYALKQAGLEAAGFAHAGDFFDACRESLPDLVLLDIMLPEIDGLEVLAQAASPSSSRSRSSTCCAHCFATSGACCRAVSCSRTYGA